MLSCSRIAVAAWLLVLAAACAKTTDESGLGTNTNWLNTCGERTECEDDESCVCGVCTVQCQETRQCSDVHAATTCRAAPWSLTSPSIVRRRYNTLPKQGRLMRTHR